MRQDSRNISPHSTASSNAVFRTQHLPLSFTLNPVPPFRLDFTVWALRRRPENILDRWDGQTYRRALSIHNEIVEVAVEQSGTAARPRLSVTSHTKSHGRDLEPALRSKLETMLGLKIDLGDFYAFAAKQKIFRPLTDAFLGFKPPRYPTIFEALLNAISCQQVSLNVGIMLLNRLSEKFGRPPANDPSARACPPVPMKEGPRRACPSPADLAEVPSGTLRAFGYSQNKERAILELSRAVASGELNLEAFHKLDDATALEKLLAIRGVGRWSAEYTLLRGMGRLNIFPGDDVGGWRNLQKHLRLRARPDYAKTRKLLANWTHYAGLLYMHFLLDGLRARGTLTEAQTLPSASAEGPGRATSDK